MPKIVDHEKRRAELAEVAWRTIAAHWIDAASMRRVAEAAGCSTGVLAHYFEDKDDLLLAALAASFGPGSEALERHASRRGLGAIRALLRESLPLSAEQRERWALWLCFWAQARSDPRIAELLTDRYDAWREFAARSLRDAQARGEISRTRNVQREAQALLAFVDGLGRQAALSAQAWGPRRVLGLVEDYLSRL